MSNSNRRDYGSHDTNVYCIQCQAQIGVVDNQWEKLTSSYAKPMLAGISFNTEISRKTQVVPAGSVQKAAEGCVMAEVLCSCSTMVGQYCVSGNLDFVGQQYFKLSRIILKDAVSTQKVKPIFSEHEATQPLKTHEEKKPGNGTVRQRMGQAFHQDEEPSDTFELEEDWIATTPAGHSNGQRIGRRNNYSHTLDGSKSQLPTSISGPDTLGKRHASALNKAVERLTGLERRVDDHSTRLTGLDMRVLRSEDSSRNQREMLSEHARILEAGGIPTTSTDHRTSQGTTRSKPGKKTATATQDQGQNQEQLLDSGMLTKHKALVEEQQKQIHELTLGLRAAQRNITSMKKKLEATRVALTRRVTAADVAEHISRALFDVGDSLAHRLDSPIDGEDVQTETEQSILQQVATEMLRVARRSHRQVPPTLGKRKRRAHDEDDEDDDDGLGALQEDSLFMQDNDEEHNLEVRELDDTLDDAGDNIVGHDAPMNLTVKRPRSKHTSKKTLQQADGQLSVAEAIDFSDDDGVLTATISKSISASAKNGTNISASAHPSRVTSKQPGRLKLKPKRHKSAKASTDSAVAVLSEDEPDSRLSINDATLVDSNHQAHDDDDLVGKEQQDLADRSLDGLDAWRSRSLALDGIDEAAAEVDDVRLTSGGGTDRRSKDSKNPSKRKQGRADAKAASTIIAVQETNEDLCDACGTGGTLLCCDACPKVFHRQCLSAEMGAKADQEGEWHCPTCALEAPQQA